MTPSEATSSRALEPRQHLPGAPTPWGRPGASSTLPLPALTWVVVAGLALWAFTTANPLITMVAVLMLPIFPKLLRRVGEPPVLLFAALMQYLQAVTGIFLCNARGHTLDEFFNGPQLEKASWLSLIGVLAVTLGMAAAMRGAPRGHRQGLDAAAGQLSALRLLGAYVVFSLGCAALLVVAWRVPGLAQPLVGVSSLKWVPVILLAQTVLVQRKYYWILVLVVMLEFGMGLVSYFSNFKSVFFVLAIVLLTTGRRLSTGRVSTALLSAIFVLVAGCAWTAVKSDYRRFVNQGYIDQSSHATTSQSLSKMRELVGGLNSERFMEALETSAERLEYVDLFAQCMKVVPSQLPYERGALWGGAVVHVFMPRLFFPNKPVLDDSERARKYTGIVLSGKEDATSIGIGYIAESYIDFGPVFMFVPIYLLGVFYGWVYRLLAFSKGSQLLGTACAVAILTFGASAIETSNIKLIGTNVVGLLALGLFNWRFGAWFMRAIHSAPPRPPNGRAGGAPQRGA